MFMLFVDSRPSGEWRRETEAGSKKKEDLMICEVQISRIPLVDHRFVQGPLTPV